MTVLVPQELKTFWDALPDMPELRLAYTEDVSLPQATYRSVRFGRETLNGGFKVDVHGYEISLISDDAAEAFDAGSDASLLLDAFAPPGLEHCDVQPAEWAVPMRAGQRELWVFKIVLTIRIVPA